MFTKVATKFAVFQGFVEKNPEWQALKKHF
jgi:hypothetical protein